MGRTRRGSRLNLMVVGPREGRHIPPHPQAGGRRTREVQHNAGERRGHFCPGTVR